MARRDWNYTHAARASVGLMRCTACGKKITDGPFRYRETEDAYLPQHRACSQSDLKWAEIDAKEKAMAEKEARRLAAWEAFVSEFGMPHDLYDDRAQ